MIGRDVQVRDPLILVELVELDIEADEIAAFTGNDQEVAFVGRMDHRLDADVGEVGDGEHVHDAPGLVRRIPVQRPPERFAHGATRAVATDHEPGLHGFRPALRARDRAARAAPSPDRPKRRVRLAAAVGGAIARSSKRRE